MIHFFYKVVNFIVYSRIPQQPAPPPPPIPANIPVDFASDELNPPPDFDSQMATMSGRKPGKFDLPLFCCKCLVILISTNLDFSNAQTPTLALPFSRGFEIFRI